MKVVVIFFRFGGPKQGFNFLEREDLRWSNNRQSNVLI